MTKEMLRSDCKVATNSKRHVRYNVLISGISWSLATLWVLDNTNCTGCHIHVNINVHGFLVMAGVIIGICRLVYMSISGSQFEKPLNSIKCVPFMFCKIISDGSDCSQNISFTSGETIVMLKLSIFAF